MADLVRRRALAAEFGGTAILVAAVVGSGIMAERLTGDAAVALLANTLATVAALAVLIATLGPISGAHLNPAVTLALAVRRELAPRAAALYIAVQLVGAIAGLALTLLMFEVPVATAVTTRSGIGQWVAEAVATFGLVAVILLGRVSRPRELPWLVAGWIAAAYWFTASTSFANPAVTIGRSLTDGMTGIRPLDVPAFIAAQLAGALAAGVAAGWLTRAPRRG